jgi:hypothetical protein
MSGESYVEVSCGVRLSEVGLSEIRKPQAEVWAGGTILQISKSRRGQRQLDHLPYYADLFDDLVLVDRSGTRIVGQNKAGRGCPPPNKYLV